MKDVQTQAVLIRDAICAISMKAPTDARHIVEAYLPLLSPHPNRVGRQDSDFPYGVVWQRGNPERSAVDGSKYFILCFHIGNAVLAYYGSAVAGSASLQLQRRAELLHRISKLGMDAFVKAGDVTTGYWLSHPTVDDLMEKKYAAQVPPPTIQAAKGNADAGGGGNKGTA